MPRSTKTGRKSTNKPLFYTARFARRISVAITAFMQLPAFFASCSAEDNAGAPRKIHIVRAPSSRGALDVFVFEGEPPYLLDSYQQFPVDDVPLYVVSGPGKKRIVAMSSPTGDIYARASVTRYQDLSKESFSLLEDSSDLPFSYGEITVEGESTRSISMTVKPLMSCVRVRSVSCDFSGRPYYNETCHNNSLFLINAVCETCPLGAEDGRPVAWANYGSHALSHPLLEAEGLGEIGPERKFCDVALYCYPNPQGSPPTRLVLEGTVGDYKCYYPINLPVPKCGTRLLLDITIHRMGTDDPDSEALPGTYTLEYSTEPWYETDTMVETF